MKKYVAILIVILMFFSTSSYAEKDTSEKKQVACKSKYGFQSDCILCHIPPTGELLLPNGLRRDGDIIYMSMDYMSFDKTRTQFLAISKLPIKKITMDLLSFGGSLFDAMGMISLIREQQELGRVVEIRGRGIIASAGLLILLSGTKGSRLIDKYSLIMFHELQAFEWPRISTPSDKEDEAAIYRMIQNKVNSYIVSHSKISSEKLNSLIKKKEFWVDADGAIEFGFVDRIFNQ